MIYLFSGYDTDYDYIHYFYKNKYIYSHNTAIGYDSYIKYLWHDNPVSRKDTKIIDVKPFRYKLPTTLIIKDIDVDEDVFYDFMSDIINSIILKSI